MTSVSQTIHKMTTAYSQLPCFIKKKTKNTSKHIQASGHREQTAVTVSIRNPLTQNTDEIYMSLFLVPWKTSNEKENSVKIERQSESVKYFREEAVNFGMCVDT